jgi:hypothetical protein
MPRFRGSSSVFIVCDEDEIAPVRHFRREHLGMMRYLIARICGFAKAFANRMEIVTPLRTLFTRAGLKQAMHVPDLCRTLG